LLKFQKCLLAFLSLIAVFPANEICRADTPADNLIFIIDASGSMSSAIDGKTKISIVKDGLSDSVKLIPQGADVGAVVYGHRRKGDCSDVEMLFPPDTLNPNAFIEKIRHIQPAGMTAIGLSILNTAEDISFLTGKTVIILIADGQDSCQGSPCELLKKLKSGGLEFLIHVVGFDVDGEAEKSLSCIAESGGGSYFRAANAKELKAAVKKAIKESKLSPYRKPPAEKSNKSVETVSEQKPELNISEASPVSGKKLMLKVDSGIVREGPSVRFKMKFGLKKGDMVSLIEAKDEWYRIQRDDGASGWSHQSLFSEPALSSQPDTNWGREIKAIQVDLTSPDAEKIIFVLNGFHPPQMFLLENETPPKAVCDFFDTRLAKETDRHVRVNGNFIQGLRIGIHGGTDAKLRVVLDLAPNQKYELEPIFLRKTYQYVLTVKPARDSS
jgi:SH3-like domain-containing protein